jgi:demethylmacrocin O-methyltransferase
MIQQFLYKYFSKSFLINFRKKYDKYLVFVFKCIPLYGNLNVLALVFRTDKNSGHSYIQHYYTQHYSKHFKKFRLKKIKLFEIGVGGYEDPEYGGHSLRMWKKYFPFGKIFSLDIYDKSKLQENRIKIYRGSQVDKELLDKICAENGEFDIIIDDGSHINEHIIATFNYLFPKLKTGGIYVIEDIQTSYWDDYGGDNKDFNNPGTAMNLCKSLTDCLNFREFNIPQYQPTIYDLNIVEIHFYHNIVFIYKNKNEERSNIINQDQNR